MPSGSLNKNMTDPGQLKKKQGRAGVREREREREGRNLYTGGNSPLPLNQVLVCLLNH